MKIIYIYIENYEEIIENEEIDFKSKYKIEFKKDRIKISNNNNYIENFYSKYPNINDVTAIIGKNTSGKSSILKIINSIWSYIFKDVKRDIRALVFFEDGEKIKYFNGLKRKVKIDINIKNQNIKIERINRRTHPDSTIIYFSGIFDRNPGLNETPSFIDISTNNLVRKSIDKTYINKEESWRCKSTKNDLELDCDDFKFIDEFKKQETLKLMNYYRKINGSEWGKEILFNFPKKVTIYFEHDYVNSQSFKSSLVYENPELHEIINDLVRTIDEYIEYYDDFNMEYDKKEVLKTTFTLLIYYEIVEYLYKLYSLEINEWIIDIIEKGIDLNSKFIIENIKNIYSKEKVFYESKEEYEKEKDVEYFVDENQEDNYNKQNIAKRYNNFKIQIDGTIESINSLELNTEENINKIYKYIMDITENLNEYINSYLFKNLLDKLNDILVFEDKDIICMSPYKEILYSEDEEDEIFLNYKEEIIEILNTIKDSLDEETLIYEYEEENYKLEDKNEQYKNKEGYYINKEIEEDSRIKEVLCKYLEIINLFSDIIDKFDLEIEGYSEFAIDWNNSSIIDFFEMFDELKINTFNFQLESGILSSGQVTYFELQYRLYNLIKRVKLKKNIILLIDEGDIYMHPGIQIQFIKHTMRFLSEFFDEKQIQLIITSNSPFIISDIPNSKIIYVKRNNNGMVEIDKRESLNNIKTLGTPINELLINSFFMDKGIVGELAQDKITEIINKIYSEEALEIEEIKNIEKIIDSIGDDIIRKKLESKIKSLKKSLRPEDKRNLIELYKERIAELEGVIVE